MLKTSKPKRTIEAVKIAEDDDALLGEIQARTWWDSIRIGHPQDDQPSLRMFGNANIGMLQACNLQIPGQLCPRGTSIITNWYARTDLPIDTFPELRRALDLYAHNTFAQVLVGNYLRWNLSLYDLLRSWRAGTGDGATQRAQKPLWPLLVVDRQNVHVQLDRFGSAQEDLWQLASGEYQPWYRPGTWYRMWIQFEGVHMPRELYEVIDHGDDDSMEHERRWRALTGRIVKLLTRTTDRHLDAVSHIAAFVRGLAADETDDAEAARIHAIADAIAEGRAARRPEPPPVGTGG